MNARTRRTSRLAGGAPSRHRRMAGLGIALALVAPLSLAAAPASAVTTSIEVATPAGTDVHVSAELGDVTMSVHYSQVDTADDTYFMRQDPEDDPYGIALPYGTPFGFFGTGFWSPLPETSTVEVCLDFSAVDLQDVVPVLYRTDDETGTVWERADPSASSTTLQPCSTYPPLFGSQAFVVMLQEPPADPADLDVAVARVLEPIDIGLGEGEQNGSYLEVTLTNAGLVPARIGLGADLLVDDVDIPLWRDATWGLSEGSGVGDYFSMVVDPGSPVTMQVPDWPGKTFTFWLIAPDGDLVALETYETGGLFSRVEININDSIVQIGSVADFAGSTVFPGVTTTIEASGLLPGETYELWLNPGVDYFSFMLLGGMLANGAVQVGSATVDSGGVLATSFSVPTTAAIGDRFQLMIGDPDTRSWPAGTIEPLDIVAPEGGGTVDGPAPAALEVSIPAGGVEVQFTFPAGSTEGTTTAYSSSTGPAAVGFTMPTTPPVYLHLSTTASFEGVVEICVGVPVGTDPAGLRLYHYALSGGTYAWVDITTRYTSDAVCGETDSFSPFALGVSDGVRLTSKEQCKNGGWATSTLPAFRNQGQCVMHFARMR